MADTTVPRTLEEAFLINCDVVSTCTTLRFTWAGRLLVLLTGRAELVQRVYTEHEVGWTFTRPLEVELRPRWWRRWQDWRHRGPGGEVCLDPERTK